MLADPDTARFITRRGRPCSEAESWAETAFFVGHWQLLGYGMFAVEERTSVTFVGRVGALQPKGWPGPEIAWALAPAARGNGYAVEAAAAAMAWVFEHVAPERVISVIDPRNAASRRVAKRLGERRTEERFAPFGDPCDIWEMRRSDWDGRTA
jgi:RimJ/RimL family protein N-acetyltransferase